MSVPATGRAARQRRRFVLSLLLLLPLSPLGGSAGGGRLEDQGEYGVKAAFLLNFMRYTTWPKSAFADEDGIKAPIVLAVIGKNPFGDLLDDTFRGKSVQGRTVVIERMKKLPKSLDAHVVFCAGLGAKSRGKLIDLCARRPVLVVGEVAGFAADGALVNFVLDRSRVRFEVNTSAVKRAGISISSQLLKLARIVHDRRRR